MKFAKSILLTGLTLAYIGMVSPMHNGKNSKQPKKPAAAVYKPMAPAPHAPKPAAQPALGKAPAPTERPLPRQHVSADQPTPLMQSMALAARFKAAAMARNKNKPAAQPNSGKGEKGKECDICMGDLEEITLTCDHKCCANCLNTMIDIALREKSTAELRCIHCKKRKLNFDDMSRITNDREKMNGLLEILLHETLAIDAHAKQCPTANCKNVFCNDDSFIEIIRCPGCNETYCRQCCHSHSVKQTCEKAKVERERDAKNGTSATAQWLKQNTKPCPKCNTAIEKNEGCNHMTCSKCRYEFCWKCLKKYTGLYGQIGDECDTLCRN